MNSISVQFTFNHRDDKMLKVNKFLFCIELEMGAIIIGYVGIISSLMLGIAFLVTSALKFNDVLLFIKESVRKPNENLPNLREL